MAATGGETFCKWMMKEMKRGEKMLLLLLLGIRNRKEDAGSRIIRSAGPESRLRPLKIMIY